VSGEGWLQLVKDFSPGAPGFRRAAGLPTSLNRDAPKWGRRRMPGIAHSRMLFV